MIAEGVLYSLWDSILEFKDLFYIPDEEWIKYCVQGGVPEKFLKKDGAIFEADFGIIIKLYRNVYFYTDETCNCLKIMGYQQHLRSK